MFGLEFLSAGLLHWVALDVNLSATHIDCKPKKRLLIDVVLSQDDVRYDFSKKTAELNYIGKGAYSPYGEGHYNTESRGLTVGEQSLNHNIEFYFEKNKEEELACLQIHKVTVTMHYTPTVYVSTKFPKGTPIFNKILEHEKKHVKITQRVLDQYASLLEEQLQSDLKQGFSAGPFLIDEMKLEQQKLRNKVKKITAKVDRGAQQEAQRQHNLFDDEELEESIKYNQGIARQLEEIFKLND